MDLDFIPVAKERYDLIIPSIYFEDEKIQRVIETIRSDEFKEMVLQMGGYDVSRTGEELRYNCRLSDCRLQILKISRILKSQI